MFAAENPARTKAAATSRRALSNTSECAPEWAWSSAATKIAAQSEKAPARAAGAAAAMTTAIASARSRPTRSRLLVVSERGRQGGAGRLGEQPALAIEELALREGDGLAPADHASDAAHRAGHSGAEEAGLHLQRRRHRCHARGDHAGHRHDLVQHGAEVAALDLLHRIGVQLGLGLEGDLDGLLRLVHAQHAVAEVLRAGRLVLGAQEALKDGLVGQRLWGFGGGGGGVGQGVISFGTGRARPPWARRRGAGRPRPLAAVRPWPAAAPARRTAGRTPRSGR